MLANVKEWTLPKEAGGFKVWGFSRAAHATSFAVPQLDLQLDAGGVVHTHRPKTVCVTHGHSDHAFRLPAFVSRSQPPDMLVPSPETAVFAENFLRASQHLTSHEFLSDESYEHNHSFVTVQGAFCNFHDVTKQVACTSYPCFHSVPTAGYAFVSKRQKLKREFAGLPGVELASLRKAGTAITETVRTPLFAFNGDTTPHVFEAWSEQLSQYPVIFTECSFLHEEQEPHAAKTNHTCWTQLRPVVEQWQDVTFVLTHLSLKHKREELVNLTQHLPNVVVW